jgi:peptidoglycan hydrolase CwlO-like protein
MPTKLTPEIITAAIVGFEHQKTQIDEQIAELKSLLSGGPAETTTTPEAEKPKRGKRSLAVRRKMALAQKARWAKIKGESAKPAPVPAPKPKRKLSAAGRAAIVAATKKRWAAVKAAQQKSSAKK